MQIDRLGRLAGLLYASLCACLSLSALAAPLLPVIPGASGFGIDTPAGRFGRIHRVTNLNADGPGSLKACVDANGPRVCVFEVSGTIVLTRNLAVRNSNITIAGQTAPSPGILIRGGALSIEASDVLLQHVRLRVGDATQGPNPQDRDALQIITAKRDIGRIVVDHVSASWSTDEVFSIWASNGTQISDVTARNSIFSEALNASLHPKGPHSAGVIVGAGAQRVTLSGNLMAYNAWRNPLVRDNATDVVIVNNLVYRTRGYHTDQINFGSRGNRDLPMNAAVVGNHFILAPGTKAVNTVSVNRDSASLFTLYQQDNLGPLASRDPWSVVSVTGRSIVQAPRAPVWSDGLNALAASRVEEFVLNSAGARPADRDAVDRRVVASVRARNGDIIDSPAQVGGWPDLAFNRRTLEVPSDPNGIDRSGYTNLELWLQRLAREVEGAR